VHSASHAFSPQSSIVKCAKQHCEAKWLIKIDIADFFGSVTEIQAWRVFRRLGYNHLVAFEMARICTDRVVHSQKYKLDSWISDPSVYKIPTYGSPILSRLPQGAPTSPMLSNLVMLKIDEQISRLAKVHGLKFTRYSDDMTFSTSDSNFTRERAYVFISETAKILKKNGLFLNRKKTAVIPPGSRKLVLGLLVDRKRPRLTKEFRAIMKQHLFSLEKSIEQHANHRKFDSIGGMYRHILGLINYANMVDSPYADNLKSRFDALPWPGKT
jgi:RNA-directed DNA polymerase